jgi:hypothetical protein
VRFCPRATKYSVSAEASGIVDLADELYDLGSGVKGPSLPLYTPCDMDTELIRA